VLDSTDLGLLNAGDVRELGLSELPVSAEGAELFPQPKVFGV
jgi:hypothetical protein